jgi:hypothetical protein
VCFLELVVSFLDGYALANTCLGGPQVMVVMLQFGLIKCFLRFLSFILSWMSSRLCL